MREDASSRRGQHFDPHPVVDAVLAMVPTLEADLVRGSELPLPGVLTLASDREPAVETLHTHRSALDAAVGRRAPRGRRPHFGPT